MTAERGKGGGDLNGAIVAMGENYDGDGAAGEGVGSAGGRWRGIGVSDLLLGVSTDERDGVERWYLQISCAIAIFCFPQKFLDNSRCSLACSVEALY